MELKFISLLGWFTMVAVAWAISYNRKLFPWRTVVWGVGLQFTLAMLILKTPWGGALFDLAGKVIQKLIQFSNEGCKFVFGPLADENLLTDKFGPGNAVIFAILVTGTIIIVACISSSVMRVFLPEKPSFRPLMKTSRSRSIPIFAKLFATSTPIL